MEPMTLWKGGIASESEVNRRQRGGTRAREALWLRFRQHAELEPGGKLSILGRTLCTAGQMHAYAFRRRIDFPEVAGAYVEFGEKYGVRGDAAYCQMLHETREWTASRFVLPVAGARTTPSWVPPELSDWTTEEAVDNQMRLLRDFAMDDSSAMRGRTGLGRRKDAERGAGAKEESAEAEILPYPRASAPVRCWEDLSGGWPGGVDARYGSDIATIWRNMTEWARDQG